MTKEKTSAEILFYNYNQSEEYFKAARAVDSDYEPRFNQKLKAEVERAKSQRSGDDDKLPPRRN